MKRLSILLLALSSASAAQASEHFNGFYGSVAGGLTLLNTHMSQTFTGNVVGGGLEILMPADHDIEGGGGAGFVGLGYSHQFPQAFVLGAEITAGLTSAAVTHRDEAMQSLILFSGKLDLKLRNDFALLFKPGYVFKHHTQIYALVGPRWGNFDTTLTTTIVSFTSKEETSQYELGITAGIGLEHMLTNNLSLGLEYAYTSYGTIQSPDFAGVVAVPGGAFVDTTDNTDITVSTNSIMAQLSYYF